MTAIVGIRCKDGVVVGADGSATLGLMAHTIEHETNKKIEIIGDQVIVAGTGYLGHMQRFTAVVKHLWEADAFQGKSDLEIGKLLGSSALQEFHQTHVADKAMFTALVAFTANDQPSLCELPGRWDLISAGFSSDHLIELSTRIYHILHS